MKKHIDAPHWGTERTANLSKRMAYRIATLINSLLALTPEERRAFPAKLVMSLGTGQYGLKAPNWWPRKIDMGDYDDSWNNWKEREKSVLLKRLVQGAKPEELYKVFKVDYLLAKEIDHLFAGGSIDDEGNEAPPLSDESVAANEPSVTSISHSREPEKYDQGKFSEEDFKKTDDRRFANRKWTEYEGRIDLTKPANEFIIESMITMEVEYRVARRDLNSNDKKIKSDARARMNSIRDSYGKSATDVAMLEKQFKKAPEQESLDAVVLRLHDIRPGWRDTEIERLMARFNLFEKVDEFHKTSLERDGDEEDSVSEGVNIPKPRHTDPDVKKKIAMFDLARSERDEEPMAVGSDG